MHDIDGISYVCLRCWIVVYARELIGENDKSSCKEEVTKIVSVVYSLSYVLDLQDKRSAMRQISTLQCRLD